MEEVKMTWEEFKQSHEKGMVKPIVDPNMGHALLKSPFGPSNWRFAIKVVTNLSLLALVASVVLFFFIKWWIPVIIIILSISFMRAVRAEALRAVIETSLSDPDFYRHAVRSRTMVIYNLKQSEQQPSS